VAKAKDMEERDGTMAKVMAGTARVKEEEAKDEARARAKFCTSLVGPTFGATTEEETMAKDMGKDSGMKAMAEIGMQSDHWASLALRSLTDMLTRGPCPVPLLMNCVLTSLLRLLLPPPGRSLLRRVCLALTLLLLSSDVSQSAQPPIATQSLQKTRMPCLHLGERLLPLKYPLLI
jgi:hypothetical protein